MAMSQYQLNRIADAELRGQAITFLATGYIALFTVLPTRSTAGTELSTGAGFTGYARQALVSSLANWSGTQGAGTTAVSSGSGATADRITNNVVVTVHAAITVAWAGVVGWGIFDASVAGNLIRFGPIVDTAGNPITRSFAIGDPVSFPAGTLASIYA